MGEGTYPIHIKKNMSSRHWDSVSTLLPSSPIKQALNEHTKGHLGLLGVIPERMVLVEKGTLLWVSPLKLHVN